MESCFDIVRFKEQIKYILIFQPYDSLIINNSAKQCRAQVDS